MLHNIWHTDQGQVIVNSATEIFKTMYVQEGGTCSQNHGRFEEGKAWEDQSTSEDVLILVKKMIDECI